jgi:hypothetical protein
MSVVEVEFREIKIAPIVERIKATLRRTLGVELKSVLLEPDSTGEFKTWVSFDAKPENIAKVLEHLRIGIYYYDEINITTSMGPGVNILVAKPIEVAWYRNTLLAALRNSISNGKSTIEHLEIQSNNNEKLEKNEQLSKVAWRCGCNLLYTEEIDGVEKIRLDGAIFWTREKTIEKILIRKKNLETGKYDVYVNPNLLKVSILI